MKQSLLSITHYFSAYLDQVNGSRFFKFSISIWNCLQLSVGVIHWIPGWWVL